MLKKLCAHCGKTFLPRPQTPDQSYCSKPQCQKARRKLWLDEKRKSDFIFRDNQARAQKAWMERNPDYWRKYREKNPDYLASKAFVNKSTSMWREKPQAALIVKPIMHLLPAITKMAVRLGLSF